MSEPRHGKLTVGNGIHIPHQWSYADATARTAATGFIAADVGKLALQLDDWSHWVLTGYSPISWARVGAGAEDYKVKLTSGDLAPDYLGAKIGVSIVNAGTYIALSGDNASPGSWKVYGTDGSSTKGWFGVDHVNLANIGTNTHAQIDTHVASTLNPHNTTYTQVGAAAASHVHAGTDITTGTIDGDRLPAMSTTKKGAVPATGTPTGLFLKDDGTWAFAGGGTVTAVTGTAPITSTGGATPDIKLGTAAAPTTADALADVIWGTSATTQKALVLQAKASQSANMFVLQDSTGAVMSAFGPSGMLGVRMAPSGNAALSAKSPVTPVPLGSELVTNGTFTADTGWTHDANWTLAGDNFAAHTAGSTGALSQAVTTVINSYYVLQYTISNMTAGAMTVTVGSAFSASHYSSAAGVVTSFRATASGAVTLAFTPTSPFDGKISNVSLKLVTGVASPVIDLFSSAGVLSSEIRSGGGNRNVLMGYLSGSQLYSGVDNVGLGDNALAKIVTAPNNVAIGSLALSQLVAGSNNVAIGVSAAAACRGGSNVYIGYKAGVGHTTGNWNTFIGNSAGDGGNCTGINNTALGNLVLRWVSSGGGNTCLGSHCGADITTGSYNCAVGYETLNDVSTNSYNTGLGYGAGGTATGSRNVFIGAQAGYYETGSNKLFIDDLARSNEADGRVKALIYGVFAATTAAQTLRFNANVEVGTAGFGTSADRVFGMTTGTAPSTSPADAFQMYSADQAAGNACPHVRTENGAIVKLYQEAALTAQLTTASASAPGTPDYAIQDLTATGGYGFVTADEGQTVLQVIINLQTRLAELETRLKAQGLLA